VQARPLQGGRNVTGGRVIYFLAYLCLMGWLAALHLWLDARSNDKHYRLAMRGWKDCNDSWRAVCDEIAVRRNPLLQFRDESDVETCIEIDYTQTVTH
jgi:hypothetical protein